MDPGEAHGQPGFVARRGLQPLEGHLKHHAEIWFRADRAHGAEPLCGIVAYELVDLFQFVISKAEIGLADRRQGRLTDWVGGPDPEGVVGIEARPLAVAALGVDQHRVDQERITLPLEPRTLGATG